jgi:transcription antitermination factor NusG
LWFVLHTKSRQEKILAGELAASGVACYLPLVRRVRYYGSRKAVVEEPLFSGYVFLLGTVDQAYVADRTSRVANIIRVHDQRRLDWELQNLQAVLASSVALDPYPFLKKGTRVRVRGGPLQGLEGIVDDRVNNRLILQIETLGQAVSLEIDVDLLESLD